MANAYENGLTREEQWERYFDNHPNVLASWGYQNGRNVNCTCSSCDPEETQPRPEV